MSVKLEKQINDLAERTEALPDSTPEGENVIVRPSPANLELRAGTPIVTVTSDNAEAQQQVTKYQRLAAENPKAAVLTAFSDLEVVLRNWYQQNLGAQGRYVSFGKIIDGMERTGVLDEFVGRSLREVREIRNKVAHSDTSVNQAMADAYIESIGILLGYMILFNKSADAQQESSEDQSEETDNDDSGGSTPAGS